VVNPGKGIVELEGEAPDLPKTPWPPAAVRDDFDGPELAAGWNFIRTPRGDFWSLADHPGALRLRLKPDSVAKHENPAFVGRRQQHMRFRAAAEMRFAPEKDGEKAGLVLLQNADFQYRLEYGRFDGAAEIRLTERRRGEETVLATAGFDGDALELGVEAQDQRYAFLWRKQGSPQWTTLCGEADGTLLSTDTAGGFTGAYIGMFAACEEAGSSGNYADFGWFDYEPAEI
jgi:alpha-N-arabinofuranosidase